VPSVLSFVIASTVALALVQLELAILHGFFGGMVFSATLMPLILAWSWIRNYASTVLIRDRMWRWGSVNFETWDAFTKWINQTPGHELDELAGLPDDSWLPNHVSGGAYLKANESKT
jgi:hypothetical protein